MARKEIILHQSNDIVHHGYADSKRERRVWEDFRIQFLSEYHDLYVQSDTLLLADVFKTFSNKYIEKHDLDPA